VISKSHCLEIWTMNMNNFGYVSIVFENDMMITLRTADWGMDTTMIVFTYLWRPCFSHCLKNKKKLTLLPATADFWGQTTVIEHWFFRFNRSFSSQDDVNVITRTTRRRRNHAVTTTSTSRQWRRCCRIIVTTSRSSWRRRRHEITMTLPWTSSSSR